jgi:hypothetical protein
MPAGGTGGCAVQEPPVNRRRLIAVLTFLAGLYFVLDFIVPPTVPMVTREGVVLAVRPAVVTVRDAAGVESRIEMARGAQALERARDTHGKPMLRPVRTRNVRAGDTVTLRLGALTVREVLEGEVRTLVGEDGARIAVPAVARTYALGEGGTEVAAVPGATVVVEARDVRVLAMDYGSLDLLAGGSRQRLDMGSTTAIIRLTRGGRPAEIPLVDARVGDTVRAGPHTMFADNRDTAAQFNLVLTTMAFGMGLISLLMVNTARLRKKEGDWYTTPFFFAAVIVGVFAGVYRYLDPGSPHREFSDVIVHRILAPVGAAIFSLLAFYMASAAYRAFRIRTVEAALMMASALIVMLGQTPFGMYLTAWMGEQFSALWLPNVAGWILRVPNTALFRGLIFGIMLGAIATALRYWLNLERSTAMKD